MLAPRADDEAMETSSGMTSHLPIRLRVEKSMTLESITTLCSVLRDYQHLKSLHLDHVLCSIDTSRSKRWGLMVPTLFSREAAHRIESITLFEGELRYSDVEAVKEALRASESRIGRTERASKHLVSLVLRFDGAHTEISPTWKLRDLVSLLLTATTTRHLSIHCADPFQLPMIQDQWREINQYYPGFHDVKLPPERTSTPDATVRAHTSVCRLRSLVLHDLSIQDTRSWLVLFAALKEPPERHSIARYLKQLDMQLKPCNDEGTTAVLVAAKETLSENTRLQRFTLRGHFSRVKPHCDAVRELDQLTFFHPLSEACKRAFFSVFATKSSEQSVKRPRNAPETVLPPYLDVPVLDLVISYADVVFKYRVCVFDES